MIKANTNLIFQLYPEDFILNQRKIMQRLNANAANVTHTFMDDKDEKIAYDIVLRIRSRTEDEIDE